MATINELKALIDQKGVILQRDEYLREKFPVLSDYILTLYEMLIEVLKYIEAKEVQQ